jgi:hypothetical protein
MVYQTKAREERQSRRVTSRWRRLHDVRLTLKADIG